MIRMPGHGLSGKLGHMDTREAARGKAPAQQDADSAREPADGQGAALVTYASRKGATVDVAARIAERLERRGVQTLCLPVEETTEVGRFAAIVFGCPVYNQMWPQEGREFLQRNIEALISAPTWLFSVGSFGDDRPLLGRTVRMEPKGIDDLRERVGARDYRVFAGVVEASQWPWYGRVFFRALGGRFGDNRNWPEIERWSDSIAYTLGRPD